MEEKLILKPANYWIITDVNYYGTCWLSTIMRSTSIHPRSGFKQQAGVTTTGLRAPSTCSLIDSRSTAQCGSEKMSICEMSEVLQIINSNNHSDFINTIPLSPKEENTMKYMSAVDERTNLQQNTNSKLFFERISWFYFLKFNFNFVKGFHLAYPKGKTQKYCFIVIKKK